MIQSKPELIDIAVNLTDSAFDQDREQVIERARQAGIGQMVITGSTLAESRQAIELCQSQPHRLFSTAGIHPHYSRDYPFADDQELFELYQTSCVKAIGETGLDFNRDFSPREDQQRAFERQLELACQSGLPVLMHERDAHQRFIEIVAHFRDQLGPLVLHCFTGDKQQLFRLLDLDLHIGITGWICDERRGQHLQEVVKSIPLGRLMLETDAPYLLPRDLRPKPKSRRNEPYHLAHICHAVASHLDITPEQLAQATSDNAKAFFNLPPQDLTSCR